MLYFLLGCKKDCRTYLYKPHGVCETSGEDSNEKRKKSRDLQRLKKNNGRDWLILYTSWCHHQECKVLQ